MHLSEKKILSYLRRADVVAENSPDAETKVGSVLVSKKTLSVVSEGYNGFVRGTNDDVIPKTRPKKYDYVIHAEANLLANAARNGVRTDDTFIVQTISPCVSCARLLYQAGIDTIFYRGWYKGSDKIKEYGDLILEFTKYENCTKIIIKPNKGNKLRA